jgi:hypothetical protein
LPKDHTQTSIKIPALSDEEKRKILTSSEFSRYFTQASRVIERALAEEVIIGNILVGTFNDFEFRRTYSSIISMDREMVPRKCSTKANC